MSIQIATLTAAATTPSIEEEQIWECNATGGAFAITLPDATKCGRAKWTAFKSDSSANAVTVTCAGTQKILGTGGLVATYALSAQGNSTTLVSDGTQWLQVTKI